MIVDFIRKDSIKKNKLCSSKQEKDEEKERLLQELLVSLKKPHFKKCNYSRDSKYNQSFLIYRIIIPLQEVYLMMKNSIRCIKIKDGLYFGNGRAAEDVEFLLSNKFTHIINCASEIGNYYEQHGIKYLKFKFIKNKEHYLWDEDIAKLNKMHTFIQNCEQNEMCCLLHSNYGANRGIVMLIGYLMMRFQWKLYKSLEFLQSKNIPIGLSHHYVCELQRLESILELKYDSLSIKWLINFKSNEEEIISKTYINTQEIKYQKINTKHKQSKHVTWKHNIVTKNSIKQPQEILIKEHKKKNIKIMEEKNVVYEKMNNYENNSSIEIIFKKNSKSNAILEKKKIKSEEIKQKQIKTNQKLNSNGNNEVNRKNDPHQSQSKHEDKFLYLEIIKQSSLNDMKKKKKNNYFAQSFTIQIEPFEESKFVKTKENSKLSLAIKKNEKRQLSNVKNPIFL